MNLSTLTCWGYIQIYMLVSLFIALAQCLVTLIFEGNLLDLIQWSFLLALTENSMIFDFNWILLAVSSFV